MQIVGKTGKTHGLKGFLQIYLTTDVDWESLTTLFIEIDNTPVPYRIEQIKFLPKKIIVKLKSVNSLEDAKQLSHKNIWIPSEYVLENESTKWKNYLVFNSYKHNEQIGIIIDIITHHHLKWLLVQTKDNKEILLPLGPEWIEKTDDENKKMYYRAIDGLY